MKALSAPPGSLLHTGFADPRKWRIDRANCNGSKGDYTGALPRRTRHPKSTRTARIDDLVHAAVGVVRSLRRAATLASAASRMSPPELLAINRLPDAAQLLVHGFRPCPGEPRPIVRWVASANSLVMTIRHRRRSAWTQPLKVGGDWDREAPRMRTSEPIGAKRR